MKRTLIGIGIGFLFIFCLGLSYSNRAIETTDKILITDSSDDTHLNKWSQVVTFIEDNIDAIENDLSLNSALTVTDSANTGAATITIDGTEKSIFEASDISELDANDIRAGMFVSLRYDGTQWQQISQSGN